MKFLFITHSNRYIQLAQRLHNEGNLVDIVGGHILGLDTVTMSQGISKSPDITIVAFGIPINGPRVFGNNAIGSKLMGEFGRNLAAAYGIRVPKDLQLNAYKYKLNTEIWFCNGNPIYQYMGGIPQDKFLTGDLGPTTDGESYIMWPYKDRNASAIRRTFTDQILNILKKNEYSGPLTIKTVISEQDNFPYFVGFLPHIHIGTFAMLELMEGELGKLISDIVFNQNPRIDLRDEVACTITVSTAPYPYNGTVPYGYYTGSNKDWRVARRRAKDRIDELEANEWQYRLDGGAQAQALDNNDEYRR